VSKKILNWGEEYKMETKKADVCRGEFGLVECMIQTIWKNRTKVVSAFEQDRSRVKRLRKPERSDIDESLLKWFKQQGSENIPVSAPHFQEKSRGICEEVK
jgi:hypothetical protein